MLLLCEVVPFLGISWSQGEFPLHTLPPARAKDHVVLHDEIPGVWVTCRVGIDTRIERESRTKISLSSSRTRAEPSAL